MDITKKKLPVMGLCYAAKLTDPRTRTSVYLCALCNTKMHGGAFQHFVGANHQAKYIVKHFPKLYEKVVKGLASVKEPKLQITLVRNIFRKLYRKIENAKGLRTVTSIASNLFTKQRRRHMNNLINAKHYDEKTITITDDEVNVLIRKNERKQLDCDPENMWLQIPFFCGHAAECWEPGRGVTEEMEEMGVIVGSPGSQEQFFESE